MRTYRVCIFVLSVVSCNGSQLDKQAIKELEERVELTWAHENAAISLKHELNRGIAFNVRTDTKTNLK